VSALLKRSVVWSYPPALEQPAAVLAVRECSVKAQRFVQSSVSVSVCLLIVEKNGNVASAPFPFLIQFHLDVLLDLTAAGKATLFVSFFFACPSSAWLLCSVLSPAVKHFVVFVFGHFSVRPQGPIPFPPHLCSFFKFLIEVSRSLSPRLSSLQLCTTRFWSTLGL
jgi:hypothetical protein